MTPSFSAAINFLDTIKLPSWEEEEGYFRKERRDEALERVVVAIHRIYIYTNGIIGSQLHLESSRWLVHGGGKEQTLERANRHPGRAAGVDPYRVRCPYGLSAFLKSTTPASSTRPPSLPPATSEESRGDERERSQKESLEITPSWLDGQTGHAAEQDDEETEQGSFDDTIGET